MRLCVVVDRNRASRIHCGDCNFARYKTRPPFCELFNVPLTTEQKPGGTREEFELIRVDNCFGAQRMGEDPTCRDFGIEEG